MDKRRDTDNVNPPAYTDLAPPAFTLYPHQPPPPYSISESSQQSPWSETVQFLPSTPDNVYFIPPPLLQHHQQQQVVNSVATYCRTYIRMHFRGHYCGAESLVWDLHYTVHVMLEISKKPHSTIKCTFVFTRTLFSANFEFKGKYSHRSVSIIVKNSNF